MEKVVHYAIGHTTPLTVIARNAIATLVEYPDGMRLWQLTENLRPIDADPHLKCGGPLGHVCCGKDANDD